MTPEMQEKLSKYMMENGFYNTRAIREDEGMSAAQARFMDIFGDSEDDEPEVKSEILQAAEAHNQALVDGIKAAEAKAQDEILSAPELDWNAAETAEMTEDTGIEDMEGRPVSIRLKYQFAQRRNELLSGKEKAPDPLFNTDTPEENTKY